MMLRVVLSIHLLAAVYWVGETLFDAVVLGPALRALGDRPWLNDVQERLRPGVFWSTWIAIPVLVLTGVWLIALQHLPVGDATFWSTDPGRLLALKLAVVAVLVGLLALHGFVLVPRLRLLRLAARDLPEPQAAAALARYWRRRRAAMWIGRAIAGLALAAVLLGVWIATAA